MKNLTLTSFCALALSLSSAYAERNYGAWQQRAGADTTTTFRAVATAVTEDGHVAVAGYNDLLSNDTWLVTSYDAITGAVRWTQSKGNAFGDVRPAAIAADSAGNIFVGGFTQGNGRDFLVIKYDANTGTELWTKTYNNAATNGSDEITAMAVDYQDKVIVTGGSYHNGSEDFYTIKYNNDGTIAWEKRYGTSFLDRPAAIAIGPQLEVVVVGRSRVFDLSCYTTIEYDINGNQGTPLNYDSVNDDIPSDVAVDSNGNIYVTGTVRIASGPKYLIHTIKYGTNPWTKTYDAPGGNSDWAPKIEIDGKDQPVMACTAKLDSLRTVFRAAKYNSSNGVEVWSKDTALLSGRPTDSLTDIVADMKVDSLGDVIVTGDTAPVTGTDYLTVKLSGIDGGVLWQQRLNGDATSGIDRPAALALSLGGDVVVTGLMDRGDQNTQSHIGTVRYNRLALSKGDRVTGVGLSTAAVVNSLGSPSVGYDYLITRLTVKDGSKVFNGILNTANGNTVEVLQGQAAPGVLNGKFSTFTDPVPSGDEYGFVANLTGVPTGQTSGLWYRTTVNGPVLVMQTGKQAPALPAGVLVSSVLNFDSITYGVVAHITLKGTGVTSSNNSAIIHWTSNDGAKLLLRTGTSYTINGKSSNVKTLGIFSPPADSPGHGRYVSNFEVTLKVTLTDGRTGVSTVNTAGTVYHKAFSGGPADMVASGGLWSSFTQPQIGYNGGWCAVLGSLKTGLAGVTTSNDSAIVWSQLSSGSFQMLVREGGAAANISGATYTGFSPPITSGGPEFLFKATVKGSGITTANNTGIWKATSQANATLLVRTGDFAPDALGVATSRVFASFTSIAYPNLSSKPTLRATLKGSGVTTSNNSALFASDSQGKYRQVLRTGDKMGALTIKSFTTLNSVPKAMNATRSFNSLRQICALVTFTNLSQSIVLIDVP